MTGTSTASRREVGPVALRRMQLTFMNYNHLRFEDAAPAFCLPFEWQLGPRDPGTAIDAGPRSPGQSVSHYQTTHENQRHIPGMDRESLMTLQIEN